MKPNATERKVLLICGVVGGFLCTAPGEVTSAFILWGITLGGYFVHRKLLARENDEASAPTSGAPNPPEAASNATPLDAERS